VFRFKCLCLGDIYAKSLTILLTIELPMYQKHLQKKNEEQGRLQQLLGGFLDLPKKYLCMLEDNSSLVSHKKGTKLFGIGDPTSKLYYLMEGDVEVYMPEY